MAKRSKNLTLNKFQIKELSKYWFDLSKLTFASIILKLFEPGGPKFGYSSIVAILFGTVFASAFLFVGIRISRSVK